MMPLQLPKNSSGHLKKIRVMVVDNDQRNIDLMVEVLKYLGFRDVLGMHDGFEALQALQNNDVDLIITDWELQAPSSGLQLPPNQLLRSDLWSDDAPHDGFYLVKYIRGSKYSPNPYVSIIMMAGLGLQNRVHNARDCGVNEILLKPLVIETLCDRISLLIDNPRPFVTSQSYKGPCRRRRDAGPYHGDADRRKHDVRLFRHAG